MARLKSLILLSVALGATPAHAADLLPPPPSIDGYGQVVELGTGWYLRGDVGYVHYSPPGDDLLIGEELDRTFSIGGGIGYRFNEWFRADFTVDYRNFAGLEGVRTLPTLVGFIQERAELDSTSFMLNGYADLGTWYGFTPYIGAGIGLAGNRLHDYVRRTFEEGVFTSITAVDVTHDTKNLAWALMAGASVDAGSGVTLDIGYRFLRLGHVRSRLDAAPPINTDVLYTHEFRIGARYTID